MPGFNVQQKARANIGRRPHRGVLLPSSSGAFYFHGHVVPTAGFVAMAAGSVYRSMCCCRAWHYKDNTCASSKSTSLHKSELTISM